MLMLWVVVSFAGIALATPQARVECSGAHVLCSMAECSIQHDKDNTALCSCLQRNSTYVVAVNQLRNSTIAQQTAKRCTEETPCAVGEAPVCNAISEGSVFGGQPTAPGMVSTFSWGGWCDVASYNPDAPTVCPQSPWAACMTAPCWQDAEDGVTCQCTWANSSWLDIRGDRCNSKIVVSTVPGSFDMRIMPGSQYVLPACEKVWTSPIKAQEFKSADMQAYDTLHI
eukprot:gnl/MRDRNA2_/MRDRNA2_116588_c0_seq1.p1 gnl/MRDRNA2_/MRDRNA2_116588_c0~~gnl/MRDRNA2_/MRDRNA2_116588_c0_seq1.p1  ORF type:complete len:227 (-),score=31.79 gnl/MRDRNA2_/MRDRNA2_116588_c0_seq1:175-855(-)